ncbi:MAG: response regulator transcription factor [Herpetosiphonaceae bacterium]|nr:response regulator transcription factor [Herpetosiphonaceae bacterium]
MAGRRVLLIDDDANLRDMVGLVLRNEQYEVHSVATGRQGLDNLAQTPPDLVILDINLPDMLGFDVIKELRRSSQVCVLMLTGRSDVTDVVQGLDGGADDYLLKPFRSEELLARVRALLRRVPSVDEPLAVGGGQVIIDTKSRTVHVRGEQVEFTPTEYQLLLLMAQNPGSVFEHQTLLRKVWGDEYVNDTAYLKVYIWHLRRKVEQDPHEPKIVMTEWGVGYRLAS